MPIDIETLIQAGESKTLEFKADFDPQEIGETVCALLNTEGGQVVVGVDDHGVVIGVDDVAEQLHEFLQQHVSPSGAWAISEFDVQSKRVLLVDVPRGPVQPYVCKGRILFRRATNDTAATADEIHQLITQRSQIDETWERQPAINHSLEDLDEDEVLTFFHDAVDAGRLDSAAVNLPIEKTLTRLGLVVDGQPIQAAIVAFGKNLLPWYPQCSLRIARFAGTTKDEFIDQDRVTNHAFALLGRAGKFIREHTRIAGKFDADSIVRTDKPLYPVLAVREAIINALCHRDYSISGGAVSIAIFDDRMEIVSSGVLPAGLSIETLKGAHYSRPRNPLLADLFYRRGLIDLWGRGIHKIIQLCVESGAREPEFTSHGGEFSVRFLSPVFETPDLARFDLTERQSRIVASLGSRAKRKFHEIKEEVDASVSDSTFRNDLVALRDLGLVESGGFGRGAFWRLATIGAD